YNYIQTGYTAGLLDSVVLRRRVNAGAWNVVRQVSYTYYDGSLYWMSNAGDLRTVTILDGVGNALDTYYYRYYARYDTSGYIGGLKYVFGPDAYRRLVAALGT